MEADTRSQSILPCFASTAGILKLKKEDPTTECLKFFWRAVDYGAFGNLPLISVAFGKTCAAESGYHLRLVKLGPTDHQRLKSLILSAICMSRNHRPPGSSQTHTRAC